MFKPLLISLACAASLLAAPLPALAVPDAQFVPAQQTFLRASQGDSAAIAQAVQAFGALRKTEPTNPVLLAYEGAATTLQATTTWMPWKKMGYAEDGLALLDKALTLLGNNPNETFKAVGQNQVPVVLDVKLVAANTFLAVPGFMNRHDKGLKLLNDVLASPLLAATPEGFRQAVQQAATKAGMAQAVAGGAK